MSKFKTIEQMSRWELAKLMANFTVVTPVDESYNEWDLKLLRNSAFVQFVQLDRISLFQLAQEALVQFKEKETAKFLVEP